MSISYVVPCNTLFLYPLFAAPRVENPNRPQLVRNTDA